jgi:ferredoxin
LLPFYPGLFEEIFIQPENTPQHKKLAGNIEGMFGEGMLDEIHGGKTPWSRVIMVEERISNKLEVFPYERVSSYIEKYDQMAIMPCHCRNRNRMLGKGCDAPVDNCMVFGNGARWAVRHGFGRMVSKDQMYHELQEAEKHGLIHCTNNSSDDMLFICNCCGCCCYILFGITRANLPTAVAKSNFILAVDEETCAGCGKCVERCHVDALTLEDGVARLEPPRCIGCGICNITCTTESLTMTRRDRSDFAVPQKTWPDTLGTIAEEKGRI